MVNKRRPEYERLREALRELRMERDLSQEQLAARLGIRQEWVSRYEVGERRLDVIELIEVAKAIGVSLSDVLDRAMIGHD